MINETIVGVALLSTVTLSPVQVTPSASLVRENIAVFSHKLDLTNRLPDSYGNQVFSDNILLSLHYLKGDVQELKNSSKISNSSDIDWEKARKPFEFSFTLKSGEVFAFHRNSLVKFEDSIVSSTNSKFISEEGYKSLVGLAGNGVCHIASLINWVAKEAGFEVVSMVDHDFASITGITKEFGVSIYSTSKEQNLYIKNNFSVPAKFDFKADNKRVILTIIK